MLFHIIKEAINFEKEPIEMKQYMLWIT